MTLVAGETVENVILGTARSCSGNGARGSGTGSPTSGRDRRACDPLLPSAELRMSVTADAGHSHLGRAFGALRDILTSKKERKGRVDGEKQADVSRGEHRARGC